MHFSTKALLLPLFAIARAQQYGGGPVDTSATSAASETKTSSSTPGVQTVTVGENNALAFSPDTITAAVGSSIEFAFFPPLHSVTQSTFDSPCAPIANGTGFWSGAISTSSGQNANVFTLVVNDTNPIWFFCGTPTHCGFGMVGVINPPSSGPETLDQYKSSAAKVSNPPAPSVVQGGTIGPPKAADSSSSGAAATPTDSAGAGVNSFDSRSSAQWVLMALVGLVALQVASLIS